MLARIIFCVVVAAAVLAVVLLATVSPLPHRSGSRKGAAGQRTFTVYIHPTASTAVRQEQAQGRRQEASALVFHHRMTAGPESASRAVGAASGFLLPAGERGSAVASVFDTVHLTFDGSAGLSGSLCVEASNEKARRAARRRHGGEEEEVLRVVGGTGAFSFARGHAVLRGQWSRPGATAAALLLELSIFSAESDQLIAH
ncbi:hypothetical protein Zm00014a_039288 [Zea mays]|jgi:hypothetical protein|uniref:Dirigent protein n=2 Tax=Zea mays TaxID=4577 RepID=A0A1D6L3I8_MAIZE|nr:Disease resistance-responsive (dirigent-like protein) family protein [Zea mays]PWZ56043.1 hypothetical protein Zm00014a_039288 [Zea mays]